MSFDGTPEAPGAPVGSHALASPDWEIATDFKLTPYQPGGSGQAARCADSGHVDLRFRHRLLLPDGSPGAWRLRELDAVKLDPDPADERPTYDAQPFVGDGQSAISLGSRCSSQDNWPRSSRPTRTSSLSSASSKDTSCLRVCTLPRGKVQGLLSEGCESDAGTASLSHFSKRTRLRTAGRHCGDR